MSCWFCTRGLTNRCQHGTAFGTQALAGGQAEFVRVPFADGTLRSIPAGLDQSLLIMMSDIFPTGYYGASRAIEGLENQLGSRLTSFKPSQKVNGKKIAGSSESAGLSDAVVVCLGCGPVGICAIITALSKGIKTVFAVDGVDDRLEEAARCGAIPLNLSRDNIPARVSAATEGRGADAVIEVVGSPEALKSAFELLRPCGFLSSVGFHQAPLPFSGLDCYLKNITYVTTPWLIILTLVIVEANARHRINFGRVPVRTVFDDALECLKRNQGLLSDYITHEMPLEEVASGYRLFEAREARKVILKLN